MKKFTFVTYLLLLTSLSILPGISFSADISLQGDFSLWWDIYEETENSVIQPRTGNPAADVTSGFNIKRARLSSIYENDALPITAEFQIRLEDRVYLLDGYLNWHPSNHFQLYLGQMKTPSTYEAITPDTELDFISRSILSTNLPDWSLSRTPYYSGFYGTRTGNRDIGVGIKGKAGYESNPGLISYFLMMGNGLGPNLFIGGKENKGYAFTNDFGDYFYGSRLDVSPVEWLTLGGHYALNRHENILFNDGKTVFDLNRYSWSADMRFEMPPLKAAAMYGAGKVSDNYFYTQAEDLEYSGYELKLLFSPVKKLQLGIRYDKYIHKFLKGGNYPDEKNITFGANFYPALKMKIQLNYTIKESGNEFEPDLGDNILFMNLQYGFHISI